MPDIAFLPVLVASIAAFLLGGTYYAVLGEQLATASAASTSEQPAPWRRDPREHAIEARRGPRRGLAGEAAGRGGDRERLAVAWRSSPDGTVGRLQ